MLPMGPREVRAEGRRLRRRWDGSVNGSDNPVDEMPTGVAVSDRRASAADQEARLRGVALHDERSLASILGLSSLSQGASGLDPRSECLARLAGLVAIIDDTFYVKGPKYVFQFDTTQWGWIHLILGIVIFLAGLALFSGAVWARIVGVILSLISAVVAFAWVPWYPFWGLTIVAIAVFVIWSLTAHGRDVRDMRAM